MIRRFWTKLQTGKPVTPLPKDVTASQLVAKLCMEMVLVIHYSHRTKDVATFDIHSLPLVLGADQQLAKVQEDEEIQRGEEIGACNPNNDNGNNQRQSKPLEFVMAELLRVEIDLNRMEMKSSKLRRNDDGEEQDLTAEQTFTILSFYDISASHVKIHALANWGINPLNNDITDSAARNHHPWQSHIATAMYNYFGYSLYPTFIPSFCQWGLLHPGWTSELLLNVFDHGVQHQGIPQHSHVRELICHSRLVRFVIRLRPTFFLQFQKFKEKGYFPHHCHAEAMFVGTVLHSLDHAIMEEQIVTDPLMLNVQDPVFGAMASMTSIVRAGFVPELPGILFRRRFREMKHPFYRAVYKKAKSVDSELADKMETCIIR